MINTCLALVTHPDQKENLDKNKYPPKKIQKSVFVFDYREDRPHVLEWLRFDNYCPSFFFLTFG